jgi:hypothetical protein
VSKSFDVLTFGGHRYQMVEGNLKWNEAYDKAKAMGGTLAVITTREESDQLTAALNGKVPVGGAWIGGVMKDESTWSWVTGESFDFKRWANGQPDRSGRNLIMTATGGWDDAPAAMPRSCYIVEWNDGGTAKPAPLAAASAGVVNLLALVDVKKDAVKGKWLTRPEGLQAQTETIDGKLQPYQVLGFNQSVPEEYDFEIEFTLQNGNRDVMQVLPSPNGAILWRMQVPNPGVTVCGFGPKLDGKDISEAGRTEAVAKAATFQMGQHHRSLVEVRKGSLRALLDGKEIVKWSGDFKRFASDERFILPDARHPGIACFNTITTFHKAELRPPGGVTGAAVKPAPSATTMPAVPPPSSAPAGPGWMDLMAIADPEKDAEIGLWRREGAGLIGNQDEANKDHPLLALPATVTGSYELELEFTRHGPAGTVSVLLPLDGDRIVTAYLQEFTPFAGLAHVRGKNTRDQGNPTRVPQRLENGKRYRARIQVTLKDANADINVTLENQPLFRYQGPASDLSSKRQQSSLKKGVELDIDRPALESIDPVTWHACWLRPLEGGRVAPVRGDASMGAAGGVVLAMSPLIANDPRLAQLDAGYQVRYESDARKPFLAALASLNQSYVANGISRARAAAQAKGSLSEVTTLDAEKTAIEKGSGVPAEDAADTPESLKALRGTYRGALAKITAERDARAAPLHSLYLKALDVYVAELTKAGKIDEAKKVQTLREAKAMQKPGEEAREAPQPASNAAAPKTAKKIFNGANTEGWRYQGPQEAFVVEDGCIKATGPRGNLMFMGNRDVSPIMKDFDLSMKVKTEGSANSGVFVHCRRNNDGASFGNALEVQIANENKDPQKTGSFWSVQPVDSLVVHDGEWFDFRIIVRGMTITSFINGKQVNEWTQPADWKDAPGKPEAKLGEGTIGLQSNGGTVWFKDIEIAVPK